MESAFGIEHGYEISKTDKKHAIGTVGGGVAGTALGAAAATPLVHRAGAEQNTGHYANRNMRRYTKASKWHAAQGARDSAEGLDATRQYEHAGVSAGRATKYAKEAETAFKSRNKLVALATGTVVAGGAAGAALGHFATKPRSKTGQ